VSAADLNGQSIVIKRGHSFPNEGPRYLLFAYGPKGGERFVSLLDQRGIDAIVQMITNAERAS
jgi:hypothetical protein